MVKKALKPRKLIVGITAAILVVIAVLAGVITILLTGSQGKQETFVPDYVLKDAIAKIGNYSFSIAWITDTQLNSRDDTWGNLSNYLVSISDVCNIKAVVHTGDIVENGNAAEEWNVANASMGVLLDNNLPYCWCTGNHDWDYNLIGEYEAFQPSSQETETYWYSSYGNCSTAIEFTSEGHKFLIIALEMFADSSALAWFTNILDANLDKNILVATHSYLNATGGYGDQWGEEWGNNLRATLDNYPNVFATINGHWATSFHQVVGNRTEMLADYMNTDFMVVTYLSFDTANEKVYVNTYQHPDDIWYNATAQNFSFDLDLV